MKKTKLLSTEDRILWHRIAKSTVPLKGKRLPDDPVAAADEQELRDEFTNQLAYMTSMPASPAPEPAKPVKKLDQRRLDRPTQVKIAKGKLEIAGKVDLHGMTQQEAYSLLLGFLARAFQEERRYVMIVTGKGLSSGGMGVLRRAVPEWLATPPFRIYVSSFDEAARHHGGSGALYIRLRKRR